MKTKKPQRITILVSWYTQSKWMADVVAISPDGRLGYGRDLESATVIDSYIGKWVIHFIRKYKRFQ